jgi:hypothetical protein
MAAPFCSGCSLFAGRLYDYRGGYFCGPCILAFEKEMGGLGFSPHGRQPSAIVTRVLADYDADTQSRMREKPSAEDTPRD